VELGGKRLLVTGGGGFLGSHLTTLLDDEGAETTVARSCDYDLTEQGDTRRLFAEAAPEIVIHLAADVGGIGANRVNPGRYFYGNMAMGLNVIEESRRRGVEKTVQIGTVCAYPKHTPVPFREEDLWNGYPEETNAPYGVAKKALLVMLQGYRQQYGMNGIYLLPANLYGPRDDFDLETSHVIPALIRKFVDAREAGSASIEVWGTGEASREFLYVEDAARAIILATKHYDGPDPINLGTGQEITIRDLVALIANLTDFKGDVHWDSSKPDGQPRRSLDTSRARELFDFEARVSLEEGLRQTITWWENQAR
jgi:nucleoside-diphosphate-sugar epimerase